MSGLIRIIIIGILLYLVRHLFQKFQKNRLEQTEKKRSEAKKKVESEKMVRCDHCGIYIPSNEAIVDGEKNYCSLEHKERHIRENDQ